ncbi:MAG: iron-only hydrogenase system regulator [Sphaerochaetaceae bacterium]|jgi:putative iron-only hydrogenase system regulator|nr:iron-only hydrogenase system regulator [Sphaerochaetaceae bacterium]MDC7237441.1 iron-only hydrogenase system regulator [Sphaerochaetaceae bacterium]MDC7249881.1 iron-only hydrogenase system regulator [Sphaerochaetaceae bacterium]
MDTRLAIVSIIIESPDSVERVNNTLHTCSEYIIGRMGMPYPKKKVSIITIVVDGPQDKISSLSGKLGQIPFVSIKTTYSKV